MRTGNPHGILAFERRGFAGRQRADVAKMVRDRGTKLPGIMMRDLLAAVGEVLLKWGFLEHEMNEWLAAASPPEERSSDGGRAIITRWRAVVERPPVDRVRAALLADVQAVASVRNLLAHGLWSASANPSSKKEANVVCRARDGKKRTIALSELVNMETRLHALRERVRLLDHPSYPAVKDE